LPHQTAIAAFWTILRGSSPRKAVIAEQAQKVEKWEGGLGKSRRPKSCANDPVSVDQAELLVETLTFSEKTLLVLK